MNIGKTNCLSKIGEDIIKMSWYQTLIFLLMSLKSDSNPIPNFCPTTFLNKFSPSDSQSTNCLDSGQYIVDNITGAQSTTAQGFFSYNGTWIHTNKTTNDGNGGHGWYWENSNPLCQLIPFSTDLFCQVIHQSHKTQNSIHSTPRLTFVGDSITNTQLNALYKQLKPVIKIKNKTFVNACGIQIENIRSDKLSINNEMKGLSWIEKVCTSDISIINYGAHATSQDMFTNTMINAMKTLFSKCGQLIDSNQIKIYFRTTAEGNPLCNSNKYKQLSNMNEWNHIIWPIINNQHQSHFYGEIFLYNKSWHWNEFQNYNKIASNIVKYYNIHLIDIVPMTRLRPTMDWHRPKKPECFHQNRAIYEWNTLILNTIAAELCIPY